MTAICDPDTYDRLKAYFASIREPMPKHYVRAEPAKPLRSAAIRLVSEDQRMARQAALTRQRLHEAHPPRVYTKPFRAW